MVNKYSVIIPAAGSSQRFDTKIHKLDFVLKNGKTILEQTISIFVNDPRCDEIILVVQPEKQFIEIENPKIKRVLGAKTRFLSVYNGVQMAKNETIIIHDAARPFLSKTILEKILQKDFLFGTVILSIVDSIFQTQNNQIKYLNRDEFFLVQINKFPGS